MLEKKCPDEAHGKNRLGNDGRWLVEAGSGHCRRGKSADTGTCSMWSAVRGVGRSNVRAVLRSGNGAFRTVRWEKGGCSCLVKQGSVIRLM